MSSRRQLPFVVLALALTLSNSQLAGQDKSDWHIVPNRINIQMGQDRVLQVLDSEAQELRGALWSVDNPDRAEIGEEDGRAMLHAKGIGSVRVTAELNGETRYRDIQIWSAVRPLPIGTTYWGNDPIGREIGDLPAVPTGDGPTTYALEQTPSGRTYLRAVRDDGIQLWSWLLPEQTRDVELVCGDWMGGALISANHPDSFTLYTVGKDGKLRWQRAISGLRKGHAYNLKHLIHILSQSADGTSSAVNGIDEETGEQRFELTLPQSSETQTNVDRVGGQILCAARAKRSQTRTIASRLLVNSDGLAYIAFTQNDWTLSTNKCTPGTPVRAQDVRFARDERVVLWQIHPDGTYRSTVLEEAKNNNPMTEPTSAPSPTGAIIPDGLGGLLVALRWSHSSIVENVQGAADELVYRIDENGDVLYKTPMPKYEGPLHDEMVLGEDEVGFATRGNLLIAFNVRSGRELWRWEASTPDIEVFAALANGHCLVQLPTVLVEVGNSSKPREVARGRAIMDWQGRMYLKHN